MDDLPNEILFELIKKPRYIDVFSFSIVYKRFYLTCLGFDEFRERFRTSKQILGYNVNGNFGFLSAVFYELVEDISAGFNDTYKDRKSVFQLFG